MPYSTRDSGLGSEGLRGDFEAVALVKPGVGREELKRQIEQSLARFNEILVEYELEPSRPQHLYGTAVLP